MMMMMMVGLDRLQSNGADAHENDNEDHMKYEVEEEYQMTGRKVP